jgi:hypothetical protein
MLARIHALDRLRGVHLGRRGEDHRIEARQRQRLGEIGGDMADAIFVGGLLRAFQRAADDRDHLDAGDVLQPVEVLFTECSGAGECDLHGVSSILNPSPSGEGQGVGLRRRGLDAPGGALWGERGRSAVASRPTPTPPLKGRG